MFDAALQRQSEAAGHPLKWDEREQQRVDSACAAADHVEELQKLLAEELDGERRASVVANLMKECRMQRQAIANHMRAIDMDGEGPQKAAPKSTRRGPGGVRLGRS